MAAANKPGMNNKSFHIPAGGYQDRVTGRDGKGPSWLANPNVQYGGCLLFAVGAKPAAKTAAKGKGKRASRPRAAGPWRLARFPLVPWAMVAAGKTLLVAGPRDKLDRKDAWASLAGRAGGSLYVLNADDGTKLSECSLDAPPVWNGMAAANRRLYIAARDGRLLCFKGK